MVTQPVHGTAPRPGERPAIAPTGHGSGAVKKISSQILRIPLEEWTSIDEIDQVDRPAPSDMSLGTSVR